ncbi:MAG: lytic transglycosylase domain-containing protein [Pseudomonadota bacterium]
MRSVSSIHQIFLGLCLAVAVTAIGAAAEPRTDIDDAEICDHAANNGAESRGVPLKILRALTRTETGRSRGGKLAPWPWTVNMEGEGFWFDTRQEALDFVLARHAAGARSFDVGCFQINYRWHGEGFSSIEAMFDPLENARYAAGFIADLKAEGRDWIAAAGAYHSRTPQFAKKYRDRFSRILAGLGAPPDPNTRLAEATPETNQWPEITAGAEPVRGGLFAALPAHAEATGDRKNWRGGVALTVFADEETHLLTRARPLFE